MKYISTLAALVAIVFSIWTVIGVISIDYRESATIHNDSLQF